LNHFGIVLRRNRRWVIGLIPLTAAIAVVALLGRGVEHVRDAAERSNEALGQICLGLHNYESVNGALPPWAVTDKDGKLLLSWRVLILPYIEEQERFKQFHLDEPWDSPHNIALLDNMPNMYRKRTRHANPPPNTTYIHVFVGKDTPFEPGKRISLTDFKRAGTANTLLLVEGGEPVPWSKPADIEFDPDGPFPNVRSMFPDLLRTIFAGGTRRSFPLPLDEAEFHKCIRIR
jgi:hypothetical protein